jgi:hypothetical protein
LAQRIFQIVEFGRAKKALDLNRDATSLLLGGKGHLRSQVDVTTPSADGDPVRIVGDGPAILDQRVLNGVVVSVTGGHNLLLRKANLRSGA